jgi:hypothetical protein
LFEAFKWLKLRGRFEDFFDASNRIPIGIVDYPAGEPT